SPTSPTFAPSSLKGPPIENDSAFGMSLVIVANRLRGALFASAITALPLTISSAGPAAADFRLCNNTSSRVGIAIGYKDADGWTTEGWWNLPARTCETILKGNLVARYYYVYAIDYDHGGEWMGQAFMCTRDKEFTIRGIADCLARGFDRTGFFEVDTGEQRAWTVQFNASSDEGAQRPLSAGNALAPPAAAPSGTPVPAAGGRSGPSIAPGN